MHVRFTPNSDIDCVFRYVRFGPKADIRTAWLRASANKKPVPSSQRDGLVLTGQERRDAAHRDATIGSLRSLGLHLEILLAVTLRGKVLRRDAELFAEHQRDRLCPTIRQRQVVNVRPDGI